MLCFSQQLNGILGLPHKDCHNDMGRESIARPPKRLICDRLVYVVVEITRQTYVSVKDFDST